MLEITYLVKTYSSLLSARSQLITRIITFCIIFILCASLIFASSALLLREFIFSFCTQSTPSSRPCSLKLFEFHPITGLSFTLLHTPFKCVTISSQVTKSSSLTLQHAIHVHPMWSVELTELQIVNRCTQPRTVVCN